MTIDNWGKSALDEAQKIKDANVKAFTDSDDYWGISKKVTDFPNKVQKGSNYLQSFGLPEEQNIEKKSATYGISKIEQKKLIEEMKRLNMADIEDTADRLQEKLAEKIELYIKKNPTKFENPIKTKQFFDGLEHCIVGFSTDIVQHDPEFKELLKNINLASPHIGGVIANTAGHHLEIIAHQLYNFPGFALIAGIATVGGGTVGFFTGKGFKGTFDKMKSFSWKSFKFSLWTLALPHIVRLMGHSVSFSLSTGFALWDTLKNFQNNFGDLSMDSDGAQWFRSLIGQSESQHFMESISTMDGQLEYFPEEIRDLYRKIQDSKNPENEHIKFNDDDIETAARFSFEMAHMHMNKKEMEQMDLQNKNSLAKFLVSNVRTGIVMHFMQDPDWREPFLEHWQGLVGGMYNPPKQIKTIEDLKNYFYTSEGRDEKGRDFFTAISETGGAERMGASIKNLRNFNAIDLLGGSYLGFSLFLMFVYKPFFGAMKKMFGRGGSADKEEKTEKFDKTISKKFNKVFPKKELKKNLGGRRSAKRVFKFFVKHQILAQDEVPTNDDKKVEIINKLREDGFKITSLENVSEIRLKISAAGLENMKTDTEFSTHLNGERKKAKKYWNTFITKHFDNIHQKHGSNLTLFKKKLGQKLKAKAIPTGRFGKSKETYIQNKLRDAGLHNELETILTKYPKTEDEQKRFEEMAMLIWDKKGEFNVT